MTFKSEYFNKFTPNRFRARIRLRLSEFLLSALFIDDVLLTALADADAEDDDTVIGVDNVCNADSLIEWLASPWLLIWSSERLEVSTCVNCDKQDTDQGRSEFRRFVRMVTFGGWLLHEATPTPPPSVSLALNGSAEPPITSVEVHCEIVPSCKHVATESDGTSEVSESRAAESDSI